MESMTFAPPYLPAHYTDGTPVYAGHTVPA